MRNDTESSQVKNKLRIEVYNFHTNYDFVIEAVLTLQKDHVIHTVFSSQEHWKKLYCNYKYYNLTAYEVTIETTG